MVGRVIFYKVSNILQIVINILLLTYYLSVIVSYLIYAKDIIYLLVLLNICNYVSWLYVCSQTLFNWRSVSYTRVGKGAGLGKCLFENEFFTKLKRCQFTSLMFCRLLCLKMIRNEFCKMSKLNLASVPGTPNPHVFVLGIAFPCTGTYIWDFIIVIKLLLIYVILYICEVVPAIDLPLVPGSFLCYIHNCEVSIQALISFRCLAGSEGVLWSHPLPAGCFCILRSSCGLGLLLCTNLLAQMSNTENDQQHRNPLLL